MSCLGLVLFIFCLPFSSAHRFSDDTDALLGLTSEEFEQPSPQSSSRGTFSDKCKLYPGKRVVLVTVNYEYLDMFQNWLHFAKPFLQSTEQLRVVAEEIEAIKPLKAMQKDFHFDLVHRNDTAYFKHMQNGSTFLEVPENPAESENLVLAPWNSEEYKNLVFGRPNRLLSIVEAECSVLYADIDTAWVKDPFKDIGAAGEGEMYMTLDDPKKETYCSCFLYVHPKGTTKKFLREWQRRMKLPKTHNVYGDQDILNEMIREPNSFSGLSKAVLPVEKFPPGKIQADSSQASVYHANWRKGHEAKVQFMIKNNVWVKPAMAPV